MSPLIRYSRWLSPKFKQLHSLTNQLPNFSLSAITSTNHEGQPSRPGPPPIQVGITESAGRGVFSTRRIGAAELIHTAKPVVSHPSLSKIGTVCYLCLRRLNPVNHSQTLAEPFCSEDCREQSKVFYELEKKADWSAYHKYCRDQGLKNPLLVKRLACMVISGATSADRINILQPAQILHQVGTCVFSLVGLRFKSYYQHLLVLFQNTGLSGWYCGSIGNKFFVGHPIWMAEGYSLLRGAFEAINMTSVNLEFLTKQWYADVLARIRINAFRIEMVVGSYEDLLSSASASVEAQAGVGSAVYILPSFYNHDCDPNVHIIWIDSTHARLQALRDIEQGEELCICYIDASMDHNARQNILLQGFGFKCSCHRCSSSD